MKDPKTWASFLFYNFIESYCLDKNIRNNIDLSLTGSLRFD